MNAADATSSHLSPTVLVAEDEPLLAAQLQRALRRLWPSISLLPAATDGLQAIDMALREKADLIFLDIRMPGASGLEAARAIVEDWPDGRPLPLIVFVTAYDEFAVQAFEAYAVDYLMKPVTPDRLRQTVQKLQSRLAERAGADVPNQGLTLPDAPLLAQLRALLQPQADGEAERLEMIHAQTGTTVHLVPVEEVLYFEAADKYIRVVTARAEHLIRMPLRDLLQRLDGQRFWQIHRGTVVQVRAVSRAEQDDNGRLRLILRERDERLVVSRVYASRWKGF